MTVPRLQEVEDIHARTFGRGARTIGVTSPQLGSGASTVARALATRCALSGNRALLVDMSLTAESIFDPGTYDIEVCDGPHDHIMTTRAGYDVLPALASEADKYRFRDARSLQEMLKVELGGYNQIVLDLSHVPNTGSALVPGSIGAAACDAVVLVCRTYSVTQSAIESAVKNLADHHAKIAGLVMNDRDAPTLAHEIRRELTRFQWLLPQSLRALIESKIAKNKMLNSKL
ncbi:MAG: hypothetical protein H2045_10095 [Rhizobiales bacterium]|nr:hypothetical protein [Hyphomicrobiales bacterium]